MISDPDISYVKAQNQKKKLTRKRKDKLIPNTKTASQEKNRDKRKRVISIEQL